MSQDALEAVAPFIDLQPDRLDDLAFYVEQVNSPDAAVLELGCGTGRILAPLTDHVAYIHGLDKSEAMLSYCRQRLANRGVGPSRAQADRADITFFDLGAQFDLITAPGRVFQSLVTDRQIAGVMSCIREHLKPGGTCILNAFNPVMDREALLSGWANEEERLADTVGRNGHVVRCYHRRLRVDATPLTVHPQFIYRTYEGDRLIDEASIEMALRCWYPDEFCEMIQAQGFTIKRTWGGYHGEAYGQGPELIVAMNP